MNLKLEKLFTAGIAAAIGTLFVATNPAEAACRSCTSNETAENTIAKPAKVYHYFGNISFNEVIRADTYHRNA